MGTSSCIEGLVSHLKKIRLDLSHDEKRILSKSAFQRDHSYSRLRIKGPGLETVRKLFKGQARENDGCPRVWSSGHGFQRY